MKGDEMSQKSLDLVTYSMRMALYDEYCKELAQYDPEIYKDPQKVNKWASEYITEGWTWVDITLCGQIVGFVIIGEKSKGHDVHPQFDYFIEQTFILPEYRRNGFVSRSLMSFIKYHKGRYGLEVLQKNFKAQEFWKDLISRVGGYRITVDLDGFMLHGTEYLWGFEVK